MLKKLAVMATMVTLGLSAHAQESSSLTREQVRSEYLQARASNQLPTYGEIIKWPEPAPSGRALTRAEVLRDLRIHGPVASGEGADAGSGSVKGYALSRAEVHAQAVEAVRDGLIIGGER